MIVSTQTGDWRKSSHSADGGGDCVEVRYNLGAVRDSKNSAGPALRGNVRALVAAVKCGLDRQ